MTLMTGIQIVSIVRSAGKSGKGRMPGMAASVGTAVPFEMLGMNGGAASARNALNSVTATILGKMIVKNAPHVESREWDFTIGTVAGAASAARNET
jgi:hypothetical protein